VTREGAGIDAGDAGDAVAFQVGIEGAGGAPVAGFVAALADDESGDPWAAGFVVVGVDAIVADQRVGHADDLAAERGVGADLLVARHRRREDSFALGDTGGTEGTATEDAAVGQGEGGVGAGTEGRCRYARIGLRLVRDLNIRHGISPVHRRVCSGSVR
jgi:hypothetical protein